MTEHLTEFLQFLRLNRNASAHTVRAYESDLSQFLRHVAAAAGVRRADLTPSHLDRLAIRSFLADLHKRGLSRASAARKLAAARTFLRYLRREGLTDDDSGTLVPTPKREVRMPAHLSEDEMARLLDAPEDDGPLGRRARRPRSGRRERQRPDGEDARQRRQTADRPVQQIDGRCDSYVPQRPRAA